MISCTRLQFLISQFLSGGFTVFRLDINDVRNDATWKDLNC